MVKSPVTGSVSTAGKKSTRRKRDKDVLQEVALAAISAIAASDDNYFGTAVITVIVIVIALRR